MSLTMSPTASPTASPLEELTAAFTTLSPSLLGPLLLGPFALGLIIYVYAFCSQGQKRRAFGRSLLMMITRKEKELQGVNHTHICLFTLLILDALTASFGITAVIMTLCAQCPEQELACIIIHLIWFAFRCVSLSQHLIMALIAVVFLYHPTWGSGLRSIGKMLNVPVFILLMVSFRVNDAVLIGIDVYNLLLTVAVVVSCFLDTSSTLAKQRKTFGLLAVIMYVSVCLPNSILNLMMLHSEEYLGTGITVLYVTNFYFILDAVLFYFVLKIKGEDQPEYEGAIQCD